MDKKCDKYEAYFTFATQEDFDKHLSECKDCRTEKEIEDKLSYLIKDSAATYKSMDKAQKRRNLMLKAACSLILVLSLGTFISFKAVKTYQYEQYMTSTVETSVISEEGLPVDEYGFFDYQ